MAAVITAHAAAAAAASGDGAVPSTSASSASVASAASLPKLIAAAAEPPRQPPPRQPPRPPSSERDSPSWTGAACAAWRLTITSSSAARHPHATSASLSAVAAPSEFLSALSSWWRSAQRRLQSVHSRATWARSSAAITPTSPDLMPPAAREAVRTAAATAADGCSAAALCAGWTAVAAPPRRRRPQLQPQQPESTTSASGHHRGALGSTVAPAHSCSADRGERLPRRTSGFPGA